MHGGQLRLPLPLQGLQGRRQSADCAGVDGTQASTEPEQGMQHLKVLHVRGSHWGMSGGMAAWHGLQYNGGTAALGAMHLVPLQLAHHQLRKLHSS